MLEEFMGIPTHPLLIHAAVIFVPLLALLGAAYVVVPVVRPHIRLVLGALAVMTPGATLLTKLSGDAFFRRMQERGTVTEDFIPVIQEHQELGTMTLVATIVLSVVTLALVYVVAPRAAVAVTAAVGARTGAGAGTPGGTDGTGAAGRAGTDGSDTDGTGTGGTTSRTTGLVLGALVIVAAAVSLYYVVRTGDSGAKAVWTGQ